MLFSINPLVKYNLPFGTLFCTQKSNSKPSSQNNNLVVSKECR